MASKHIHRTAVFTLHNPTRHVRAVLDHALTVYTHAYTVALEYFAGYTVEELQARATFCLDDKGLPRMSTKSLIKALFQRDAPVLTDALQPLEGSMRESLKEDVAETLLSYTALASDPKQKAEISYPRHFSEEAKATMWDELLSQLATIADNLEEENALRDQLNRKKQAEFVPISFIRVEHRRNCGLYYNPDTQRFYARLDVVSPKSHYAKPLAMAGHYIDIRTGAVYARDEDAHKETGIESFGKGKTSILVLLEMGKYHEQALRFTESAFLPQRTKEGKSTEPVSAKLVKDGEDYRLHVAFRLPKPERVKPATLLGVDRGITCLAAGAITSPDGKTVLETFIADGTQLRALQQQMEQNTRTRQAKGQVTKGDYKRAKVAEYHVNLCANLIVELAIKHQAQVVMEDLDNFAQPRDTSQPKKRNNFRAMLSRRQYENILKAVDMKLTLVGLPPVRTVGATFTSLTCSACGNISADNRSIEDRTQFLCTACGHTDHADSQAGINIARKLLWLQLRSQEAKAAITTEKRTSWATFAKTFMLPD